MTKLAEYINITRELVREVGGAIQYDSGDKVYEGYIRRALRRYSIDKPRELVSAVTGTDSKYITIDATNLPNFVDGFSYIDKIEASAPTIASNERPSYLERDEWEYYRDDSAYRVYFVTKQPTSSDTIRFTYTALHTINELDSATADTIPTQDQEAIILFAASQAFSSMAGLTAGSQDPSLRSDVVNYKTKSAQYMQLSKEMKKQYDDWISDPLKAASAIRDLDYGYRNGFSWQTHSNAR
jgi:hypothetical protein